MGIVYIALGQRMETRRGVWITAGPTDDCLRSFGTSKMQKMALGETCRGITRSGTTCWMTTHSWDNIPTVHHLTG